ncbi:MAG TPA: hypothetical protein DHW42_03545 [Candidatus Marinimicrobia bacterium]|nr:hypothetical protein [Candidatus Neomarinimicrobiota bacterium]
MPRMKDVLKSYDNLKKEPEKPDGEFTPPPASGSGMSGLDAIRQAIQSQLKKQKTETTQTSPPPATPQSTINRNKAILETKAIPVPRIPTQKQDIKPLAIDDEQASTQLYMTLHRSFERITTDITNNIPIDPKPLIESIPDFCTSIEQNEYIFLKAIQRKRYATWVISHSINVGVFSVKIGLGLRYEKNKLQQLALAAFLHDVGMIKVPNKILFKHGKLEPSEFEVIRQHPIQGYEIIKHLKNDYSYVIDTTYQEHEREDGSGYPQGLKGDEIAEFAKVVGIADVFEALVHGRAYREGYITYHAIQKIIENKSKQFNPKIIRGLVNSISMFPIGSYVELNSGEIARVISINKPRPVRPIVEIIEDANKKKLETPLRINLEEEPLLYISKPIAID